MKHLMRYEGFSTQDRVDELLDKIKAKGINSLTDQEREFLDAFSKGQGEELHNKMNFAENEVTYEDDGPFPFKFIYREMEDYGDETYIYGTITVPDIEFEKGKRIDGEIDGKIVVFENGMIAPDFTKEHDDIYYDIFEFCEGLEYELDNFLQYIVDDIEKNTI